MMDFSSPCSPQQQVLNSSSFDSYGRRKQKFSNSKPQSEGPLPEQVRSWTSEHIELLNIHYDHDFLPTPMAVLSKISGITELTEKQKRYLEIAKYYLPFDINISNDLIFNYEIQYKAELDSLINKLDSDNKTDLENILYGKEENKRDITEEVKQRDAKMEILINWLIRPFIFTIKRLLKTIEQKRICDGIVPEIKCCELPRKFAELCQLQSWKGKDDPSVRVDFIGVEKITSEPDYRLYKLGMSALPLLAPETVVSVIEVKSASYQFDHLPKRKRKTSSSNDPDSSTSSSRPVIQDKLSSCILSQHGAELLLDFLRPFAFGPKPDNDDDPKTLFTMPGMIIDGTKVYFTLLEMTRQHQSKLKMISALAKNEEYKNKSPRQILEDVLDLEEDKATIYYSQPYDILRKKDRDILLDSFMRLNNIPNHGPA